MNIEHKKTALDDDSLLYQKRDDSLEKKDTSGLSRQQKLDYFKDYYLAKLLIAAAVAIFVLSFLYNVIFHRQVSVLNMAFVNDAWMQDIDGLRQTLTGYYELPDEDHYISVDNYNLEQTAAQMKLSTLIGAQMMDILICSPEEFTAYAAQGAFLDLAQELPPDLYQKFQDVVVEASKEETDQEGAVIKTYPAAPYGIDISDNAVYRQYGGAGEKAILAVMESSKNRENALRFLEFLANPA